MTDFIYFISNHIYKLIFFLTNLVDEEKILHKIDQINDWREHNISPKRFTLLLSIFVGAFAGLMALALKTSVFYIHHLLFSKNSFDLRNTLFLLFPTFGIALTVILRKYIIRDFCRHDVSAILNSISNNESKLPKHKMFSSVLGAAMTAGFGGSIGLEAPIVSTGSAIGSNLSTFFRLDYKTTTLLLACGAAGAIAAVYNAPLAGIVFAFEILLIDLSQFTLLPLLLSALTGTIITKVFFRTELLFEFQLNSSFTDVDIPFFILFGITSGCISVYFSRMFLFIEDKFSGLMSQKQKLLAGGLGIGVLIFIFPPLYGEGFATIRAILLGDHVNLLNNTIFYPFINNRFAIILFFGFLVFLKVVATSMTLNAGGIGGIFAPALFTGAVNGFCFAMTINSLGITYLSVGNFALVGMAAMFAGILHAPLTAVFLIAGITGGYQLMVPLLLATTISFLTVKYLEPESIDTQRLAKKGDLITHHKDRAILHFIKLEEVLETDFLSVSIDANLGDLVRLIEKSKRDIFPVIDSDDYLMGVVQIDDIRDIMFDKDEYDKISVWSLMNVPPTIIHPSDSMELILNKFADCTEWCLPVVEKGKYLGFVTKAKVFENYREVMVKISTE